MTDILVYALADGVRYLGCFDGQWCAWPAEARGWDRRRAYPEADAATATAYDTWQAELALRLSGYPLDD